MLARTLASLLPYIIVALLALATISFIISLQQLRRGRIGPYWRMRRAAGQRGGQMFLISITLYAIAFTVALFTGLADLAYRRVMEVLNPAPTAIVSVSSSTPPATLTFTLAPTTTPLPTVTTVPSLLPDTPTATASLTPTGTATPSSTPTLTLTPTATFPFVLELTAPTSVVEPLPDAMLEIVNTALGLTFTREAQDPTDTFPVGTTRIYVFYRFSNLSAGVTWTRVLLREGVPIQGGTYPWTQADHGNSFFFFGDQGGYPPGSYEVRLFVGDRESSRLFFTVAS